MLFGRRPDYASVAALEAFDRRVAGWAEGGRIAGGLAAQVRALIAADRALLLGRAAPGPQAADGRRQATDGREAAALPTPAKLVATPSLPLEPAAGPRPPASRHTQPDRRQLLSALVALASRRTLLFLGSFLLAVSALTLVVFNWASFPPIIQLGLLTSVVASLWAGGAWMISRPDLATAGRNLQAVAGLLVPVVAFALTRPGLLDLAPRASWLTVSLLSLPPYLLAAWRTGRGFYSLSAAISGVSAALAATFAVDVTWLGAPLWPPALAALALTYLAVGVALEGDRLPLARPVLLIAPLLAGAALIPALRDPEVARTTLPLLAALGAAAAALVERGRLAWAGAWRHGLAAAGLALAALLLPGWLLALLDLSALSSGERGLILAPLAAAYFAGARWWPGKLRPSYDRTLQTVGAMVAIAAGAATLLDRGTWVPGAALLALIWGLQATLRKGSPWAALALGSALMAGGLALLRAPQLSEVWWMWAGVGYAAVYAIGGSLLRGGPLGHWTWPAIGWASVAGLVTLAACGLSILLIGGDNPSASLAILALAGTLALTTAIWRRGWVGYPAAALLVAGAMLAAHSGFYTGWAPATGDLALAACALAAGLGLLGQGLRAWAGRAYALPYEQAGLALLSAAPLLAGGDPAQLTLTWLAMAALYGLATWRHRLPWLLAAAWVALDMGLLHGSAWLFPGGRAEGASMILLAAVAAQALSALWRRRSITSLLLGAQRLPGAPSYTAAAIGGAGALLMAAGGDSYLAGVALGLAAILGIVATGELSAAAVWGALALLALGLGSLHSALGLAAMPSLAWGLAEALALYAAGWAASGRAAPGWKIWRDPLRALPAIAGLAAGLLLVALAGDAISYRYLTISLGGVGLLLALVARREGQPWLYTAALASADLAALTLALWRMPALTSAQLAPIMLAAAAAQTAGGIWLRSAGAGGRGQEAGAPLYAAAMISGALALGLSLGSQTAAVVAALALAGVAGAAACFERRNEGVWLAVCLSGLAALTLPGALGASRAWAVAWVSSEMLAVVLVGWGLERANGAHWRRPSSLGPLVLALLTLLVSASSAPLTGDLPALTLALASSGLLLATLAVRLRQIGYGYAAGAAIVAAGLCQLADWGVRELQGYVLPAGLYLLALAAGLRRFQGQRKVSQVIEAGAALLLLGATLGQAIRSDGALYELLLCGESLAVAAYGALLRLRVPFLAGVGFFVAGVLWMVADNVRINNQWAIFGSVGLLMIAAYVLLERYQERLLRAGQAWASELKGWG